MKVIHSLYTTRHGNRCGNISTYLVDPSWIMIGSESKNGMHFNSNRAWYKGCVAKSPTHLATMIATMMGRRNWISFVISICRGETTINLLKALVSFYWACRYMVNRQGTDDSTGKTTFNKQKLHTSLISSMPNNVILDLTMSWQFLHLLLMDTHREKVSRYARQSPILPSTL